MHDKSKYWISYIVSTVIIAWLCSYLVAKCPCNTSMVTGLFYVLACYLLLFISIIFHFRKLTEMNLPLILLIVTICTIIGGLVIGFVGEDLQRTSAYNMLIYNYFMEYFATIIILSTFNLTGIIITYIAVNNTEN